MERDEVVRAAVGETALKHFLIVKRHELATYETHVHPWERETYLEIDLTMIEVEHLPVVDVHCHPFLNRGAVSAEEFTDLTAFGGGSREYMEAGRARLVAMTCATSCSGASATRSTSSA